MGYFIRSPDDFAEYLLGVGVPGTHVVHQLRAVGLAAVEEVGQVLGVHVVEQLLLVAAADDLDLVGGLLVEEGLEDHPHAREQEGRVDDEHAA